ncbi:hypothetical protein N177_0481 [Lutibaculum baratangense AMV1]|uniref:Uncharacterized protein n=1 Tax=Lutibaculum baratangense AMV1 TaxID=631454 RepID=V4R409_9HYPH|nr:hypothetical protein N177_0481 [Lutibaculum baratangense AMV1]
MSNLETILLLSMAPVGALIIGALVYYQARREEKRHLR